MAEVLNEHSTRLTDPEHIIRVGKAMLVGSLTLTHNIVSTPQDAESITRILQCPHCARCIVEYGTESLPSKHNGGISEELMEAMQQKDKLASVPCNHHGGETYEPAKHLRIYV